MKAIEKLSCEIDELKELKATKLLKSAELTPEDAQLVASKRHLRTQIMRLKREKTFLTNFDKDLQ